MPTAEQQAAAGKGWMPKSPRRKKEQAALGAEAGRVATAVGGRIAAVPIRPAALPEDVAAALTVKSPKRTAKQKQAIGDYYRSLFTAKSPAASQARAIAAAERGIPRGSSHDAHHRGRAAADGADFAPRQLAGRFRRPSCRPRCPSSSAS